MKSQAAAQILQNLFGDEHETFDTNIQKMKRKWKYSSVQFPK